MNTQKIKIAIQKKGRLNEPSQKYLRRLNIKFPNIKNKLSVTSANRSINIIMMRDNDIPRFVSKSAVDLGIVGLDIVNESRKKIKIINRLGFCKCRLVIAVPIESGIKSIKALAGKRIATTYPNILKGYLKKNNIKAKAVYIEGSVEVAPYLFAADAVCDITQTGRTLREFNLAPIKTILQSEAVLLASPKIDKEKLKLFANS